MRSEAAETVVRVILEAYHAPNISMEQMRADWIERGVDPLRDFSAAAREELLTFTHQSLIKTTFLLYFTTLAGIMTACDAMGVVSIIGRWRPFA